MGLVFGGWGWGWGGVDRSSTEPMDFSGHCAGANLAGLAAKDGKLYVSLRVPGEVVVYSSSDMSEVARWKVAQPAGLAFSKEGKLFAISGQVAVELDDVRL